jgi:hypothetical protein
MISYQAPIGCHRHYESAPDKVANAIYRVTNPLNVAVGWIVAVSIMQLRKSNALKFHALSIHKFRID